MIKSSLICIAVAISVFTTGCASSSSGSVNPSLKKDEPKFFSKSGGSACLIAATAGCAAGMTANYMLDKTRADYHNLEDQLDASKKQVQDSINSTKTLKATSEQTLEEDRAEIEKLKAQIKNGTASKDALERKLADMQANLDYMKNRLDSDKSTLAEYKSLRDSLNNGEGGKPALNNMDAQRKSEELDAKIDELERNIAQLDSSIVAYASQTSMLKNDVGQIGI